MLQTLFLAITTQGASPEWTKNNTKATTALVMNVAYICFR